MVHLSSLALIQSFAEKQRLDHINWLKQGLVSSLKEDEFLAIDIGGSYRLMPYPESSPRLFRGQNADFGVCLPTIYRNSPPLVKRILDMAKINELKQALESIGGYKEQLKILGLKFSVDYEALAQHYGLASRYIDFTSNPLVAGFFATSKFDVERSKYLPIAGSGIGVFYEVNRAAEIARSNEFEIIGLQPFQRPAQQYAFGLKCPKKGLVAKYGVMQYKFLHSKDSYTIFDMLNGGLHLFPDDPVFSVVSKIKATNYISLSSLEWVVEQLQVRNTTRQIKWLTLLGVTVGVDHASYVTQDERISIQSAWCKQKETFSSKVKIRRVASHLTIS